MTYRARRINALFTNNHPYIALEAGPAFDFAWSQSDVREVIHLWDIGTPVHRIAAKLDRDPDELAVLIIDLARREIIDGRRGKGKKEGAA